MDDAGDLESCLAAIRAEVAEVFALDSVDCTQDRTDLFELGMHSFTALELLARLRDRFGLRIELRTLMEAPTISDLAQRVQDR